MIQVSTFFEGIFGAEQINFRCIKGKSNKPLQGLYNEHTIVVLNQFNKQGYECFFAVNSGGYKAEHITRINAVWADLDCGRDEHDNYFPLSHVRRYKDKKLEQINEFPIKPTYIVETRNGLHVYWILNAGTTLDQFQLCEDRLVAYLDADAKSKNVNRLLRVPDTYWCKHGTNDTYPTSIIQHNAVRYSIHEILNVLSEVTSATGTAGSGNSDREKGTSLLPISVTNTSSNALNVQLIKARNVEVLEAILKPEGFVAPSRKDVFTYLKQQVSLHDYLGVAGGRFCCVFHDDTNPSAGIFLTDSGDWMYKCHSNSCGVHGTIIELTMRMLGTKALATVMRFLRKLYRIKFAESDWHKTQVDLYESNLAFLDSQTFRQGYKIVYDRIVKYLPVLEAMNRLAKEHVTTENFTDSNGTPVFFSSIRHIVKLSGKSKGQEKQVTNVVALLTYLGLINKLSVEEIPEPLLRTAKREAAKKKQAKLVSFFSIPQYDLKTLDFAVTKATEFREMAFTMRGWGRDLLLSTLGEDEANRVYPQEQGKALSSFNEKVRHQIEQVALQLIADKGWTMEQEILSVVELRFNGQAHYKEEHIKRVLPDMLNKYCLRRTRLNKQLKQQFNIDVKGYPFVILKENEHEQTEQKRTRTEASKTAFNKVHNTTIG